MSNKATPVDRTTSQPRPAQSPVATVGSSPEATGVSVLIPTYNERENITAVVTECLKALPPSAFELEVIVVDDDSEDYTWQYPERLFGDDPRVRVIRRQSSEKGLAQSITDGFGAATHDFCAVIDADLQHPPEKLPELLDALEKGADVAIGSRHVAGGGIENWPLWRKIVSRGATTCAGIAIPDARQISDPMSGFFAVRRNVIEDVDLDPQGYKILLEILGKGDYEAVTEVPFCFTERERGESKLTVEEYQNFLEHAGELAVASRNLDEVVDPMRAVRGAEFAFVGATGSVVNMLVFAMVVSTNAHFLLAGLVAFLAAVNWNFAGNWLVTYDRPSGDLLRQYATFHGVSVVGFVAYTGTLTVGAIGGFPLLIANLFAIIAGSGINFFGTETSVFPTGATREPVSGQV